MKRKLGVSNESEGLPHFFRSTKFIVHEKRYSETFEELTCTLLPVVSSPI